jgi:hypothetical protein
MALRDGVVPLAAVTVSQEEWDAQAKRPVLSPA